MVGALCYQANGALTTLRRLVVFGALIGKVPPKPLWAEMLWQQQGGHGEEEAALQE